MAYAAKVMLPPGQEQVVSAPVAGVVDQLLVGEQQAVKAGQPLLRLNSPQFGEMQLKLLEAACRERGIKTHILTGETKGRMEVVNAFQADPEPCVFLLSLRAAGTGLNLTNASYVVLYDPWWNQIGRAHV